MTRIVVAAKKDQVLLQDTQSKSVVLDQASIIQIGVTQQDVKTLERSGDKLIIHLKNGEQIVLEGFFQGINDTAHSLAFPKADGTFSLAHFDETGKFINYTGLQKLDTLLYEGANTVPAAQITAYESGASTTSASILSNLFSSSAAKAGLGVLSAIGLGLALIDNGDNTSSSPPDITAPKTPTATINAEGTKISGTAEAGATIYVVDKNEKVIATAKVDKEGNYSVTLPDALVNNNSYYVKAKDDAGNSSGYVQVTGTKDTIAPIEPQAQLNDQGNIVTGKSEANATINVYDSAGHLIGTAKANTDGIFSVAISPALTAGQVGYVEAIDAAGNKSEQHKIELGKDTIAPDQPKFEVAKDGSTIQGSAEANAKVIIQDSNGTVIATGTVDAQGKFNITISPALDATHTGKIVIEDEAGNQSTAVEIKAGQDILAPEKPVASLNAEGTIITGTAEAHSKITVYDSSNKLLGTTTADANGNYSVTLSTALTEAKVGNVYATDIAGNQSVMTSVVGTKDITPPASPKITDVVDDVGETKGSIAANGTTDDKRPVISGTGEAGATLIIYDNNKAVGKVTVGTDNKWSFNFDYDLTLGSHSITSVQTDKAGNTSLMSDARTFTVIEVTVKTALADEHFAVDQNLVEAPLTLTNSSVHSDINAADALTQKVTHAVTNNTDLTSEHIAKLLQAATVTEDPAQSKIESNVDAYHGNSINDLFLDASVSAFNDQQIDQVIKSSVIQSGVQTEPVQSNSQALSSGHYTAEAHTMPLLQTDVMTELLNPHKFCFN